MVGTCIAQLKKNKEEAKEGRKPFESSVSCPAIPSKNAITW
jgi:hypothetical protein